MVLGMVETGLERGNWGSSGGFDYRCLWGRWWGFGRCIACGFLNSSLISQRRSFRPLPGEGTLCPTPQHTLFQLGILIVHWLKKSLLYNISMAEKNQTIEIWGEGFQFLKSSRWEVGKKSLRTKQDQQAKRQLKTSKNRHISTKKTKIFSNFPTSWCFQRTKLHLLFLQLSEKASFSNQPVF